MKLSRVPVAVWVSTFQAGGTERQMAQLIRGLDPARYEVHAACFAARGCWLSSVAERAVSVAEFPIGGFAHPSTWREVRRYARWCRDHAIRIVLTSDFYTNVFGLAGAALAGVPVRIGGRREINTDKTPAKLLLQRAAYAAAHRVVANSRAAAARLRAEGVAPARIAVVPNGVDSALFAAPRTARPMRCAVTIANLRPEKGHDVLIDALATGRGVPVGMELKLVGDGPCRPALERQVRERGLGHRVQFLGECDDVARVLAEADVFILPSRTEAFPNSLMEAMAAGLPVVASRVGGIPELVEDGVTGLLVPPGEPQALGDALSALARDGSFAEALGRAARAAIQAKYSIGTMVAGFESVFAAGLDGRVPAGLPETAGAATARR